MQVSYSLAGLVLASSESGFFCCVVSWFAVHCTSMNNTNVLISGDNKGYASYLFEKHMNQENLTGEVETELKKE